MTLGSRPLGHGAARRKGRKKALVPGKGSGELHRGGEPRAAGRTSEQQRGCGQSQGRQEATRQAQGQTGPEVSSGLEGCGLNYHSSQGTALRRIGSSLTDSQFPGIWSI